METKKPQNIDEYIAGFPEEVRPILQQIRVLIHQLSPDATETIRYDMPTFNLNGTYLVYFAAFKTHIGFYPAPIGVAEFEEEFKVYKTGRGSIQFPLKSPMPIELITKIVKYRIQQNAKKSAK